jgi:hypothetical protein
MKLFWGLIDTKPEPKHQHTFHADKWIHTNTLILTCFGAPSGSIDFYQNTCLTCGKLIEEKFKRQA